MKSLKSVVLLVVSFLVFACGSSTPAPETPEPETSEDPAAPAEPTAQGADAGAAAQ